VKGKPADLNGILFVWADHVGMKIAEFLLQYQSVTKENIRSHLTFESKVVALEPSQRKFIYR
jgi:uncharacterized protein (DUF433 family)